MNTNASPPSAAKSMTHLSAESAVGVARYLAGQAMPYFGSDLLALVFVAAPELPTMAVTERGVVLYNPAKVRSWTAAEAAAVVLHEHLHLFLHHARRFRAQVGAGLLTADDARLWNLAADMEINVNLREAGQTLPVGAVYPETYKLAPGKLAEEYAAALKKMGAPLPQKPLAGGGWDGSGAGCPVPGEPDPEPGVGRTDAELDAARVVTAEAIRSRAAGAGRGSVPWGLLREAEALLAPPRVPWQQRIPAATQRAVAYRPGAHDYTHSRPSRRQAAVGGLGALAPVLPATHAPVATVCVAVDTSGSMGTRELDATLSELRGILGALPGMRVVFIACDSAVHAVVPIRTVAEARAQLKGGGGTDFRPIFAAADAAKPRPDVLIIATDGDGPAPAAPPRGMRVIWLIVPGGRNRCAWGDVIEMAP